MLIRGLILASLCLACLGCPTNEPCDDNSNPDYWKPLTASDIKGCWNRVDGFPVPSRDTLNSFCFSDSTVSWYSPSQTIRQFTCKHFEMAGNTMSIDSTRLERYDSLDGAWNLTTMYRNLPGNILTENWAISKDTLRHFQVSTNPYSCGTSMNFEYKYVRQSGRIDSSGIRHCDSLGYR